MLDNFSDSLGVVMLANGDDPARSPTSRSTRARARKPRPDSGHIRRFTGNDYTGRSRTATSRPPLVVGRHRPAPGRQRELEVGIPQQGGMIWTDNMLIPKGGDVYTASVYMNYVYDPKVAASSPPTSTT